MRSVQGSRDPVHALDPIWAKQTFSSAIPRSLARISPRVLRKMPPKWAQPQAAPAPAPAAPAAAAAAPSPVPAGNLDAVETLQVVVPEPAQNGKAWPVDSWKADPNAPDNYAQFTAAINDMSKEPGGKLTLAPNAVYKFTTENIFYIRVIST